MNTILRVEHLRTQFKTDNGTVEAVNDVNFSVQKGEVLGIVGESGSGKTVTGMSIMGLLPRGKGTSVSGGIFYEGVNLLEQNEKYMCDLRGSKIAMIFQDPMTSLNPFLRISTQLTEVIKRHLGFSKRDAKDKAIELLRLTGVPKPEVRINDYPHQFSGGMRQRIMIAMAISCEPELIIADEPTTALDVTIQAQVMELFHDLKDKLHTSVMLITHDLGVVAGFSDRVHVMYAGKIVEKGSTEDIFETPKHPYTRGLLASIPRADASEKKELYTIPGQPPLLVNLPPGCPFAPRCGQVKEVCTKEYPEITAIDPTREVSCWLYEGKQHGA